MVRTMSALFLSYCLVFLTSLCQTVNLSLILASGLLDRIKCFAASSPLFREIGGFSTGSRSHSDKKQSSSNSVMRFKFNKWIFAFRFIQYPVVELCS